MFSFFENDRLSLRLVLASVLIGSILSIFSTGVQLYSSFERQKEDATAELDKLEQALAPSLARALWEFNFDQVEIALDGLITDDTIGFANLTSSTGQVWNRGELTNIATTRTYTLNNPGVNGEPVPVGHLNVSLNWDAVKERVWAQFWTILASSMLKAYLGAFAFLFVVQSMVIRHLRKIATHIDNAPPVGATQDLRLDRAKSQTDDDLDKIANALTEYGQRVTEYVEQIKKEVAGRKGAETCCQRP